jgi:hypothetical protein
VRVLVVKVEFRKYEKSIRILRSSGLWHSFHLCNTPLLCTCTCHAECPSTVLPGCGYIWVWCQPQNPVRERVGLGGLGRQFILAQTGLGQQATERLGLLSLFGKFKSTEIYRAFQINPRAPPRGRYWLYYEFGMNPWMFSIPLFIGCSFSKPSPSQTQPNHQNWLHLQEVSPTVHFVTSMRLQEHAPHCCIYSTVKRNALLQIQYHYSTVAHAGGSKTGRRCVSTVLYVKPQFP